MINAEKGNIALEGSAAELIADLYTIVFTLKKAFREVKLENPKAEIKKIVLEALDDEPEEKTREEAKKYSTESMLEELINMLRGKKDNG